MNEHRPKLNDPELDLILEAMRQAGYSDLDMIGTDKGLIFQRLHAIRWGGYIPKKRTPWRTSIGSDNRRIRGK